MGARPTRIGALSATLLLGACGTIGVELVDPDTGVVQPADSGAHDSDAAQMDASAADAGAMDASTMDASTMDASTMDASTTDASTTDAGATDAGHPDASVMDASSPDAGADTGTPDASDAPDASGLPDASAADAGTDSGMDAGAAHDSGEPDAVVDTGPPPCDLSGTWGSKIQVQVSWPTTTHFGFPAVEGGSGTARVWVKYQAASDGSVIPGSMVACGVRVPPMNFGEFGAGGGTGQVSFDISLFETAPPATTEATLQVQGGGFAGDSTTWSQTALLLGVTMANPLSGSWPTRTQLSQHDVDNDGRAGVTLPHLNSDGLVYLPTKEFPTSNDRSNFGYYAWRVVWSASGILESCTEIAGTANVTRFDSHVLGCQKVTGSQCNSTETTLLDDNRPQHQPGSASYQAKRISDADVPCSTIRSELP